MWPKRFTYFWSIRNLYTLFSNKLSRNECRTFTETTQQKKIFKSTKRLKFTFFDDGILKQKHGNATQELCDFLIILEDQYLIYSNIFWRCGQTFHWKHPPTMLLDVKKSQKSLFLMLKLSSKIEGVWPK